MLRCDAIRGKNDVLGTDAAAGFCLAAHQE